jgi:hypothetical protein
MPRPVRIAEELARDRDRIGLPLLRFVSQLVSHILTWAIK